MRILSTDVPGAVAATNITTFLTNAGYTLPHPALAYTMYLAESTRGSSDARVGGPDVSATKGIPFATAGDKLAFPPVLGAGGAPSRLWNLDTTYLYIPLGDTISIAVWVD